MSRIGKKPIQVPVGVKVSLVGKTVTVEGPTGRLTYERPAVVEVGFDSDAQRIVVTCKDATRLERSLHGLARSLLANMVQGVVAGYSRSLDIVGVGYNAKVQGKFLELSVGFCHPVSLPIPDGVLVECPKPVQILIRGADKQKVGQFAADIRRARPPEPYNGKGIKYSDEVVRRKAGKAFVSGGK